MASSPKFLGLDGVLRQEWDLSTTLSMRFFTGTIPEDTVDLQVSVRGSAFTSDSDLVTFEGTSFTFPNPSAYPDGIQLYAGRNSIKVRAVLSSGMISEEAVVEAWLSTDSDVSAGLEAPSGVFIERKDTTVVVYVEGLEDNDNVVGYHFYASPQPGGGEVGYFRVNPQMVISGTTVEVETDVATLSADPSMVLNGDGGLAADPLYFRLRGSQEDSDEVELSADFDEVLEVSETTTRLRITTSIKSVRETRRFSFEHDRQATLTSLYPAVPHAELATVPSTTPLYYVASAVHLIDGVEYESPFSPEVVGSPIRITASVGAFPQVSRQQIVRDTVLSIYRTHPQLRVDPGSVLRDTFIEPFATEADRLRFVIGFLHVAQSFPTLLSIDDPTLTGQSLTVRQSPYKTALKEAFHLSSDADVQAIIDNAFEKLASNYGVTRSGGTRARGEVTFYTTTRPTSSIVKSIGTLVSGGGITFRTTSIATISSSRSGGSYNASSGRYSARAYIQADVVGSSGNLAAGQINSISGNTLSVKVVNESPTFGGRDRESNKDLAQRAMRVLSSVDSGTLQGYKSKAVETPGVVEAVVVDSGHDLMVRDIDSDGNHVGGKVDVYVRGLSEATVSDSFAFTFNIRERQQFEPVGATSDLVFRAVDPALSEDNPLIEILDLSDVNLTFENVTQGYHFDLTDVEIISYNQIQLSSEYNDPTAHGLLDEVRGSYRYRTSNKYVFTRQPVIEVKSFVGEDTGAVSPASYALYRASDPLENGRSTMAGDYLQVVDTQEGLTIPSSTPLQVVGESHVMLDDTEYLNRLGANYLTIRVWNTERTVEYNGPLSTSDQDFTVVLGDATTPVGIVLTDETRIEAGQTVLVDYYHDENFTVNYTVNAVVSAVQNNVEKGGHITADILAKWAVEVPVDITATVVVKPNSDTKAVSGRIRTALRRFFGVLGMGDPIRQSDVARVLDGVPGVEYVVLPLTKMAKGAGASVVRDFIPTDTSSDYTKITSWCTSTTNVFLLENALSTATLSAGGGISDFRGVFQDELAMTLHSTKPNVNGLPFKAGTGRAYIIGSEGLYIPGVTSDDVIEANYVLPSNVDEKAAEILRIRRSLTANRVLVTLAAGGDVEDNPVLHDYAATYITAEGEGVSNIKPGPVEYLVLGDLSFSFDEEA